MRALAYRNTRTDRPLWSEPVHESQPRGYAYELDTHFIHIYGRESGLWIISEGLAVREKKTGDLRQWVVTHFGAEDIIEMRIDVGHAVSGVWRPGLYYQDQTLKALDVSEVSLRSAEQALRLLVERLDELLLYIEPSKHGLTSYSHKTRELLILACTEVENQWKQFLALAKYSKLGRDLKTSDYVKLAPKLYLHEFEMALRPYADRVTLSPFRAWTASKPTQSVPWYDAYNKTKHDRTMHFAEATLAHCLNAVAANVILFCARFGTFSLLHGSGPLSSIVNQIFLTELRDCDVASFYIPLVVLPADTGPDLWAFDSRKLVAPWKTLPLTV